MPSYNNPHCKKTFLACLILAAILLFSGTVYAQSTGVPYAPYTPPALLILGDNQTSNGSAAQAPSAPSTTTPYPAPASGRQSIAVQALSLANQAQKPVLQLLESSPASPGTDASKGAPLLGSSGNGAPAMLGAAAPGSLQAGSTEFRPVESPPEVDLKLPALALALVLAAGCVLLLLRLEK